MEFSCHSWAFNDLLLPEAMGTIARLGFRYVDLGSGPHLNPGRAANPETRKAAFQQLRGDLTLFNLKISDVYLMLPRISVAEASKSDTDLLLFKALAPFAKALGAAGVTVSPGVEHPAEDTEAWDRTVAALRDMRATAAAIELPMSIEPHLDSMASTPERALQLLEAVDGLQLTLDWAQMVCQGIKHAAIVELLPHTRHIHIRQAAKNKLQTRFEKGKINLEEVMQALFAADYQGMVCVEYMQTVNWHGSEKVSSITESLKMRDALRDLRNTLQDQ